MITWCEMKVNLTLTSTGQKVDNYSLPKFLSLVFLNLDLVERHSSPKITKLNWCFFCESFPYIICTCILKCYVGYPSILYQNAKSIIVWWLVLAHGIAAALYCKKTVRYCSCLCTKQHQHQHQPHHQHQHQRQHQHQHHLIPDWCHW